MSVEKMYGSEIRAPPNSSKGRSKCAENDDAIEKQCNSNDDVSDNSHERNFSPNDNNSPTPPSLRRFVRGNSERNFGLLRQLSQRFGLRSYDDPIDSSANDDDNQSSSTDSCSSSQAAITTNTNAKGRDTLQQPEQLQKLEHKQMTVGSGTSTDTISTIDDLDDAIQAQTQNVSNDRDDSREEHKPIKQQHQTYCNGKELRFNSRASFSRLQRRSTSTIRKAFESFSLSTRSLSCSGATLPPQQLEQVDGDSNATTKHSSHASPKYSSNLELYKKNRHNDTSFMITSQHHESRNRTNITSTRDSNHANVCNITLGSSNKSNKVKQPPQRILRQPVSYTYLKGISGLPTQRVPRSSVCCQYVRR